MSQFIPSLWVSHSSMSDFVSCPRLYFLKQIYKDPKTKQKINIINPAMALGLVVHDTLETLLVPSEQRFKTSLMEIFEKLWDNISGSNGGFSSPEEEQTYKNRGTTMIQRVIDNPGPLRNKALKLSAKDPKFAVPNFFLSEMERIILCGKVDWLEYVPDDDAVHIIDFKTGRNTEKPGSLQLPIYCLLVNNLQKRKIQKVSYWYLETDDSPTEMPLPNSTESVETILTVARQMQKAKDTRNFACPRDGCRNCLPFEAIVRGEGTFIRNSGYQDIYVVNAMSS